jgi:hypothetical protein
MLTRADTRVLEIRLLSVHLCLREDLYVAFHHTTENGDTVSGITQSKALETSLSTRIKKSIVAHSGPTRTDRGPTEVVTQRGENNILHKRWVFSRFLNEW